MRKCSHCKRRPPAKNHRWCLRCKSEHERARRSSNREAYNASRRTPERNAREAAYRRRNRQKKNAHSAVIRALRSGQLVRPQTCDGCGKRCKPHAHHTDYEKPLAVTWLCTTCHGKEHRT